MKGDGVLLRNEASASSILLREASLILPAKGDIPREYLAALFGRTVPEDITRYTAPELAAAGVASFGHLRLREPGKPDIRIENPATAEGGQQFDRISVIEIINDDMPFLLDSVMGELNEQGVTVHLLAHPVFTVKREKSGKLLSWHSNAAAKKGRRESVIHIHVDRLDPAQREKISAALAGVLSDVRMCVFDWKEMLSRLQATIENLKSSPPPLPAEEVAEAIAFLEWLGDDNFTFLGCREYSFTDDASREMLEPVFETGLGILRGREVRVLRRGGKVVTTTPELREFIGRPVPLIITKANVRSRVHRRVHMDYIGIKRFDPAGRLQGEFRIVGLFTSTAYTRAARSIPYLRRKIDRVLRRAEYDLAGHSGKALVNVLENYPRDELFQIDEDLLFQFTLEILRLEERPRVRILTRRDRFDRFVSVLVYVPRERFHSIARERIGKYLAETYKGRLSAFYVVFPDSPLARVHFIIGRDEGVTPNPEQPLLEAAVERIVRNWSDGLSAALAEVHEPVMARALERRYREAFSAAYQEAFSPEVAVSDLRVLERLSPENSLAGNFYRREPADLTHVHLRILSLGQPLPLSLRVPVLENTGFTVIDEHTYTVVAKGEESKRAWVHDMQLARSGGGAIDLAAVAGPLEASLMAVARGRAENDGYNALVLTAGLAWREVALVRTLSRYLRQVGVSYGQDYLWTTLTRHAPIAAKIVGLFHMRFDPRLELEPTERAAQETTILQEIETALAAVESLDEDRILQRFVNLVIAAVRTNFYQTGNDGQPKPTISIKFESHKVEALPAPQPLYEIFVYSPGVEGIHLRFGKVARGGIRWSDRPQDFRTEILGLAKAQQVKNAVIVPVGAKGGFVPKNLPAGGSREEILAEGIASYELFITSLLDLTNNLGAKGIMLPFNGVRHDGDDPYLVVAADKGTATFSDRANKIAISHDFWLGDAFASGGSAGYDHKKMGITARGAWEAVRRHFREMDIDIRTTPFTVTGVGDMSGDVFGNAMLLEKTIRLVAAFDHRDIFIDPDPDLERAWAERKRLFELPRSSWQDYDKRLISKGGGVFARNAKKIALSAEAALLLRFERTEATPAEVMSAILKLPVDLLWFGGIGTFVRAAAETNDRTGDRANDAIRIAAAELQCKVIGEGANLGMTQCGRVEAARRGIRLNTDAIDNSAGVNTSDVEVNLKIALSKAIQDKSLTIEARNQLLAGMSEEVTGLVLRNNYLQTLALSLAERRSLETLGFELRLMQHLEAKGLLDRKIEFLPSDTEIAERRMRGQGLSRPELAVMLSYAKIALHDELLASPVPDDPYLAKELMRYFPRPVVERFPAAIEGHRLRREIIATRLANSMINRGGPSFVMRIFDQTAAETAAIAKAFAAVRDSYGMTELNSDIDALDARISGAIQLSLYAAVQDLLLDRVTWFLRNCDLELGLGGVVKHYRAGIERLGAVIDTVLPAERNKVRGARAAELMAATVPEKLAWKIANLSELAAAPDIVLIAEHTDKPVQAVAETYFAVDAFFQLDRIISAAQAIEVSDHFDRLALDRARVEIAASGRRLTAEVLAGGGSGPAAVEAWSGQRQQGAGRVRASLQEIAASGLTLSKLAVAASLLADLANK